MDLGLQPANVESVLCMKYFIAFILVMVGASVMANPLVQNAFTTNAPPPLVQVAVGYGGGVTNNDFQNLAGQLNCAMRKPYVFQYFNPETQNEGVITNDIWQLITNGFFAQIAAAGAQPAVILDGGWQGTNRWGMNSGNWHFYMTNWGSIDWNKNQLPDGPQYIASYCHSNGVKLFLQQYFMTNTIPAGADGLRQSWCLSNGQPFTNGVGPWPSDGCGQYVIDTTSDTIKQDIGQFYFYGIDGITLNEGSTLIGGFTYQGFFNYLRAANNSVLAVSQPYGFGQPGLGGFNYYTYDPTVVNFTAPFQYSSDYSYHYYFPNMLALIVYQTANSHGNIDYGNIFTPYQSAGYYDNSGQGVGYGALTNYLRDYQGVKHVNDGAGIVWFPDLTTNDFAAEALASCHPCYYSQNIFGSVWQQAMTNSDFLNILADPLQNMPTLYPYTANSNAGVVVKITSTGDAVGFFNNAATNITLSVNWHQLGYPPSTVMNVSNICILGNDTSQGQASGTYSVVATPGSGALVTFSPLISAANLTGAFTGNGVGLTNLNAANVLGEPFTLVDTNDEAGSTIASNVFYPYTSSSFVYSGGNLVYNGFPAFISGAFSASMVNIVQGLRIQFWTDAASVTIASYCNQQPWRVFNGDFNQSSSWWDFKPSNDAQTNFTKIVFNGSKPRLVSLVTYGGFQGVYIPVTNAVWQASVKSKRAIVVGDSWTGATGAGDTNYAGQVVYGTFWDGWAYQLQNYFHNVDIIVSGAGGTGYVNNGPYTNLVARFKTDVINQNPNYIIYAMGLNDGSLYETNLPLEYSLTYSNALWCFTNANAQLPGVVQFVNGCWQIISQTDIYHNTVNDAIRDAALYAKAIGCSIYFVDWINQNPPLFSGTCTTNDGTAWYYRSETEPGHPNTTGHTYVSSEVAAAIKSLIPSFDQPVNIPPFVQTNVLSLTDPSAVSGIYMRFEGTNLDGITSGTALNSWTNLITTIGQNFTNAAVAPTILNNASLYNGHSWLSFGTGSGSMTNRNPVLVSQPYTVILTMYAVAWSPSSAYLYFDTGSKSQEYSQNTFDYAPGGGFQYGYASQTLNATNSILVPSIYALVFNAGQSPGFINGVKADNNNTVGGVGDTGFCLNSEVNNSLFGGIQLFNFYVYTNALTQSQCQSIGNWITRTYAIGNYNYSVITNQISQPAINFGSGNFWNSNNVLYYINSLGHTNYVSGP